MTLLAAEHRDSQPTAGHPSPPGPPSRVPVWHGLADLPAAHGRCVAALGVFDGIHRGHAQLLETAIELGRTRDLPVVLVTFDPHPARVVGAPRDTSTLTSLPQRAELAADHGVDAVLVLPFTRTLAALSPADFAAEILDEVLHADAVVVGANFTFGSRAAGTTDTLTELGGRHRFTTHPVGLLPVAETTCSSTHIRSCLLRGDVTAAAQALGRPHQADTRVTGSGALTVDEHAALPAPGSYRARLSLPERAPREPSLETSAVVTIDDQRRIHPQHPQPWAPGTRVLVSFLGHQGPR